jgi:hypothetical protein
MIKITSLDQLTKEQIIELIEGSGESLEIELVDMWNELSEMEGEVEELEVDLDEEN